MDRGFRIGDLVKVIPLDAWGEVIGSSEDLVVVLLSATLNVQTFWPDNLQLVTKIEARRIKYEQSKNKQ